jgi:hypothetical protein
MVFALSPPKFICKIIRRARRRNAWTSIVGWFHLEAQVHVKIGNYCNVTGVIRVTDTCNKFSGKSCVFAWQCKAYIQVIQSGTNLASVCNSGTPFDTTYLNF